MLSAEASKLLSYFYILTGLPNGEYLKIKIYFFLIKIELCILKTVIVFFYHN